MYDVISVGSATVDVFAKTESELIKIKTIHSEEGLIAYPSGSKILIQELDFKVGGGGTNTAVAFSRLGLKTAYLGEVGNDGNSKIVLDLLKNEKVSFVGVKGKNQTGYSIILDSIENDRTILTNKGANNKLTWKDIKPGKLKTKWFYFSSMMGKSLKTLEQLSKFAFDKKIPIAFNPSNYLIKDHPDLLDKILKRTEVLIFNRDEAKLLTGEKKHHMMFKKCHLYGPKIVIITDGAKGCVASDGTSLYFVKPRGRVKVKETTGAGDAFASSFIAGFIKKEDIKFALRLGMTNAESVIQYVGAKEKLLTYRAVLKSMNSKQQQIKVARIK